MTPTTHRGLRSLARTQFWPALLLVFFCSMPGGQAATKPTSPAASPPAAWEVVKPPGLFIVSLARDLAGNVWVGTEDQGVFRYNSAAAPDQPWRQFTTKDGLGDNNAYALACDKLGRVWAGQLNHGVAVFNGEKWRTYDVPDGPLGERVFRIACCPTDGDVWIATSAGLCRYSERAAASSPNNPPLVTGQWRYYTRAEGLPSDQLSALAFDPEGNLYAGTQCDGIAIARAADDYRHWRIVPAPDRLPVVHAGTGLPAKLINDLLFTRAGVLYAATTAGLARSGDRGETWTFVRGRDYAAKVKGRTGGPPKGWKEAPKESLEHLLPEDYVTCLAEDAAGLLWLGFRQQGFQTRDPKTNRSIQRGTKKTVGLPDDYVSALLPSLNSQLPNSQPFLGSYGGGLAKGDQPIKTTATPSASTLRPSSPLPAPFPTPAKPPTLAELNNLLKELSLVPPGLETNQPTVLALEDDWRNQGDWLGRYGRFWAVLCANWSPNDDVWGAGWDVQYDARIGPNCAPGDSLRYWVQWLKTKDRRSLEMSPTYLHSRVLRGDTTWDVNRRQSEWDDHGEVYPLSKDGPHVYCSLNIPAGLFYLSLYDFNKDGHEGNNRFRDYRISIRPHPGRTSLDSSGPGWIRIASFYDLAEFDQQPEWAHGRIRDFWGGTYKRFLVRGPTKLAIEMNRNHSFNTILAGVMLDLVDELPPPYFETRASWEQRRGLLESHPPVGANAISPPAPKRYEPAAGEPDAIKRLLSGLEEQQRRNPACWAMNKRRHYLPLLRWHLAQVPVVSDSPELATCYYHMGFYAEWEHCLRQRGLMPARDIEKALRWDGRTPSLAGKGYETVSAYLAGKTAGIKPVSATENK